MLSIGSLYQAMDVRDANKEAAVMSLRIGEAALAQGDMEKAIRMLRKAAQMSPDDVSIQGLLSDFVRLPEDAYRLVLVLFICSQGLCCIRVA